MNEILSNYLHSFLHPWQTQELLRRQREYHREVEGLGQLELVEEREKKKLKEDIGITFEQSLTVSWIFVIFNAFYSLIGMFMGLHLFESFSLEDSFITYSESFLGFTSIFFLVLKVVFFPLVFWFYGKFWVNIIKVFANIFEKDGDIETVGEEIVSHAFTTHTFLVIPIIGLLLHRVANIVYLFGGLKRNLGFNTLQSILVIICPLVLLLFSFFLMAVSVAMMFTGF